MKIELMAANDVLHDSMNVGFIVKKINKDHILVSFSDSSDSYFEVPKKILFLNDNKELSFSYWDPEVKLNYGINKR